MPRHRRHRELTATELENLVVASATFSRDLQQFICDLRPTGEHYKLISDLYDKVSATVEEITGEPPSWRCGW
jgi:hypothetical protein